MINKKIVSASRGKKRPREDGFVRPQEPPHKKKTSENKQDNLGKDTEARESDLKSIEIDNKLASEQAKLGKYKEAEESYNRSTDTLKVYLTKILESLAINYMHLGHEQCSQGKHKEAEESYLKSIEIDNKLANEQFNQGKYQEAEESCKRALDKYINCLSA